MRYYFRVSLFVIICFFVFYNTSVQTQAVQNVIGVRVIKNAGDLTKYPHTYVNGILSPLEWFIKNMPNPGTPVALSIDGYPAIQEGRTIYVASTNYSSATKSEDIRIFSNIYLISYNEGTEPEMLQIVQKLIANWKFNINVDDTLKSLIQRDFVRTIDMNEFRKRLENYKNEKGVYPDLTAGTYQTDWSYSVWPSWQKTLADLMGSALPEDPINYFQGCTKTGVDPKTCWNESEKRFECPKGASVYAYRSLAQGDKYQLYTNFDYKGGGSWKTTVDNLDQDLACFYTDYSATEQADSDLDGISDQYDSCPSGEEFSVSCTQAEKYQFVQVSELKEGENCVVLRDKPGLCYQSQKYDPENRTQAQCDVDRDGRGDACDECPLDNENDRDRDGYCTGNLYQGSKVGGNDNCPLVPNDDQVDLDKDGMGDVCDYSGTCGNDKVESIEKCDRNHGLVANSTCRVNCSDWFCNSNWARDGDVCIPDVDNDGIPDVKDNCKSIANTDQSNIDKDQYGDVCDWCPGDSDNDKDGDDICAGDGYKSPKTKDKDNCPGYPNVSQADWDKDGIGDVCDCCPTDLKNDVDHDGHCGCDMDNDGFVDWDSSVCKANQYINDCSITYTQNNNEVTYKILNFKDNCSTIYNPNQINHDIDKEEAYSWDILGDVCDPDTCGDGKVSGDEQCDTGVGYFDGSSMHNCTTDCTPPQLVIEGAENIQLSCPATLILGQECIGDEYIITVTNIGDLTAEDVTISFGALSVSSIWKRLDIREEISFLNFFIKPVFAQTIPGLPSWLEVTSNTCNNVQLDRNEQCRIKVRPRVTEPGNYATGVQGNIKGVISAVKSVGVVPEGFCDPNAWSGWSVCNASCNGGTRSRAKNCGLTSTESCNTHPCCVNLYWGSCSVSCGGGVQYEYNTCGLTGRSQACNTQVCPPVCKWDDWGVQWWWKCTYMKGGWYSFCGTGTVTRKDTCGHSETKACTVYCSISCSGGGCIYGGNYLSDPYWH